MMDDIESLTLNLAQQLLQQGAMIATAESCTGGLIAKTLTDLAGSSAWFDRGFVTYSNAAKVDMLGVDPRMLDESGAVSEPTARAMAAGALRHSCARYAVAVTGIAGPGGGSEHKPVGTVWFGFADNDLVLSEMLRFRGDRAQVRQQTLRHALEKICAIVENDN
jgi:nicotinamide-nucleotide amidase